MRQNKKIILFSEIEWSFLRQRHQILAEYLLQSGYDVWFVQKVPSRSLSLILVLRFVIGLWHRQRIQNRRNVHTVPTGLKLSYSRFLPPSNQLFRLFNRYVASRSYAQYLNGGTAYTFTPTAYDMVFYKNKYAYTVVFDIIHNWWDVPWANKALTQKCTNLVYKADAIICDSEGLGTHISDSYSRPVSIVGPGVNVNWLTSSNCAQKSVPEDGVYRILFFGNLRHNSDIELFEKLNSTDVVIDVYGTISADLIERLSKVVNIKGQLDQDTLKARAAHYDFTLLPYMNDQFSKWLSPAKYYECLAIGNPILTRAKLTHLQGWDTFTYEIDDYHNLKMSLDVIHDEFNVNTKRELAKEIASANTWPVNLAKIENLIQDSHK